MGSLENIRRTLVWWAPLCIALACLAVWLFELVGLSEVRKLGDSAPSVRIWLAWTAIPLVAVFLLCALGVGVFRAIPIERIAKRVEKVTLYVGYAMVFMIVFSLFFGGAIYSHFLEKRGYTECNILQGHPNRWFSDWVRDPAWCVKGKSREWVAEQAAKTSGALKASDAPEAPAAPK